MRSVNPATGAELRRIAPLSGAQVEAALQRAAGCGWGRAPVHERAAAVGRLGDALRARREPLADLIVAEVGKPRTQALAEVDKCAAACAHFAAEGPAGLADLPVPPRPGLARAPRDHVRFAPLGPVLAILPWNFPLWQAIRMAAPALIAGDPLLVKHAPSTLGCAEALAGLAADAGLPPGVWTDLRVDVHAVPALIADRRVAAVTLTGSERAGRAVAAAAGAALKKVVLELGGSDPFVVLADAPLGPTVAAAVSGRTLNNGQTCIAAKRFIVERPLHAAFVDAMRAALAALRVGDPARPGVELGPLHRADLRAELHAQVQRSVNAGARLILGGEPVDGPGFFYPPTLLDAVPDGCPAADEELFGPAAAVFPVDNAGEALARANATRFGLAASVWTADAERGAALAQGIDAGAVFVNQLPYSDPRLPFGGVKASGYGRELGLFGLRELVNVQTVSVLGPPA